MTIKPKHLRILVWGFLIFATAMVVVLAWTLTSKLKEKPTVQTDISVDIGHKDGDVGDPLHDHATDKDMKSKESELLTKPTVSIGGVTFNDFQAYKGVTVENTGSLLLGMTNDHLLIKAYGGLIYVYDLELNQDHAIAKFGDYAVFSEDGSFVFFTKYTDYIDKTGLELYAHSMVTFQQTKLADIPDGLTVEDVTFSQGVLTYTAKDLNYTTMITKDVVLPSFRKQVGSITPTTYPDVQGSLIQRNDRTYGYNYDTNTILSLTHGTGSALHYALPEPSTIGFLTSYDISPAGLAAAVYTTADGSQNQLRVPNGLVEAFKDPVAVRFLSDDHLLVLDGSNLYVYTLSKQTKSPVIEDVARFYVAGKDLSIQTIDGRIKHSVLSIKK